MIRTLFASMSVEKFYPMAGCLFSLIFLPILSGVMDSHACDVLAASYMTIFSIGVGMSFSAISVLLGMSDNAFVRGAMEIGSVGILVKYHWRCATWCAVAVICGAVLLLMENALWRSWCGGVAISIGLGASLSVFRVVHLFKVIVGHAMKEVE